MKKVLAINLIISSLVTISGASADFTVSGIADHQIGTCSGYKAAWVQCTADLATCSDDLTQCQADLSDANVTIVDLQSTITTQQTTIDSLTTQVTDSAAALAQCGAEKAALEATLAAQPDLGNTSYIDVSKLLKKIRSRVRHADSTKALKYLKSAKKYQAQNNLVAADLGLSILKATK